MKKKIRFTAIFQINELDGTIKLLKPIKVNNLVFAPGKIYGADDNIAGINFYYQKDSLFSVNIHMGLYEILGFKKDDDVVESTFLISKELDDMINKLCKDYGGISRSDVLKKAVLLLNVPAEVK